MQGIFYGRNKALHNHLQFLRDLRKHGFPTTIATGYSFLRNVQLDSWRWRA
jgi:hypothetical protein